MGKANKVKLELRDAVEMVDLIQTLKDIADNKFFTLISQKGKFRRFGETFVEFFRMISLTDAKHPLMENENPTVGILVMSAEGSFLGKFNSRIIRMGLEEKNNHDDYRFIVVGDKAVDRLSQFTPDLKVFSNIDHNTLYETALEIKNYLVDEVMAGRLGKVIVCYSFPKSLEIQKPRKVKLLPCDELVSKQTKLVEKLENVIEESDPVEIIGYLANLWITTRLYEMLMDNIIAASAAQSQFLEESVDKMKKEKKKTAMRYRKARKGDIDKSLRETFSARMMAIK